MRAARLTRLRCLSQVIFFLLSLFLLLRREFRVSLHVDASDIHLPYPVNLFIRLEPLVALSSVCQSTLCLTGCYGAC